MFFDVKVRYGSGETGAVVRGGRLLGVIRPHPLPELVDLRQEIINGLRGPIGSKPLSALAEGARKIAIVTSDHTRPLPAHLILPVLCAELEGAGAGKKDVTVVIGVGSHRPVTEEEKKRLTGPVYGQVRCFHSQETGYKLMGVTKRGTPVEVAVPAAEADLVIGLGNIELHQLAGYTGGVKAVAAGAASRRALEHNHRLSRLGESGLGMLDGNVVRQDMEEFARIAKLGFIINVVLNESHQVVHLAAGHPVRAHRSGCAAADRLYRVRIKEKADIVIMSPGGAPKDGTVYQVQKAVKNALRAVRDGGIIIAAAKCPEGFGDPVFEQWMSQVSSPEELEKRSSAEFILGGHKGAFIASAVKKARIFWVSDMPPEQVRKLFFEPFGTVQEAVDEALQIKGDDAGILVMPWGGLTVPEADAPEWDGDCSWSEDTGVTVV